MRRGYNYQPQMVDPGLINFEAVQIFNPEDTARLAQVGQNMQQRWDASQSVIAKQLEDIGAANINPRYKADVIGKLEGDIENIYKDVNTTYQGDFGRAYTDILKSIGKSRSLLHSATQATAEESKQRDIYNQMAAAGKAPVTYVRDELGRPTPKVMSFEEYHGINKQPSFVEGKFVGPSFSTLRSAGEYEPYIERMVGHLMKQSTEEGLSRDPKYAAFLRQVKTIGQDPVALRKLFDTDQPEAQAMVEDFVRNNPTVTQEFVDESGRLDMNLAKDFLADALVSRVKKSTDYQYMQDPYAIESLKRKREEGQKKNILSQASVSADIVKNPFLEEENKSYAQTLSPTEYTGKKYNYSNLDSFIEDLNKLKTLTEKELKTLTPGDVAKGKKISQSTLTEINKIRDKYPMDIPLLTYDLESGSVSGELENKINKLSSIKEDLNIAKQNLKNRGIDVSKLGYKELADYLDNDYTLRQYNQDEVFPATSYGSGVLTKAFNDNLLAKTSGGFRTSKNKTSMPIDRVADYLDIDAGELQKQIMDSKQWNYNFNTGEFTMKVLSGKKKDKGKTIYFNLDKVTENISNSLKQVESVESNPNTWKDKRNVVIGEIPGAYAIVLKEISNGKPKYEIKDFTGTLSQYGLPLNDLNAYQLRTITKNYIIEPYLDDTYGEQQK
jgi:hypothetical protein